MDVHKWANEIFTIARNAPDMNGLESWRRVHKRYNVPTPASALTALMRVIAPGQVKHHKEFCDWCVVLEALRKDHGEELTEDMNISAMVQMTCAT